MNASRRRSALAAAITATILLSTGCAATALSAAPMASARPGPPITLGKNGIEVALDSGVVTIDPSTLAARLRPASGSQLVVSDPTATGRAGRVTVDGRKAHWTLSDGTAVGLEMVDRQRSVEISFDGKNADAPRSWPKTGTAKNVGAIQFANGTGQSIPVRDAFWNSAGAELAGSSWGFAGDLTLPVWGVTGADRAAGVSFFTPTDIGTTLSFASQRGALSATASHDFTEAAGPYRVTVTATDGSPVAGAEPYRGYLKRTKQFVTLDQKIAANPAVGKLIGAPHAYVWGDGRTDAMTKALADAGISRAWIGYDADGAPPTAAFVSQAQRQGLLVGPYDAWANAQDPGTADTPAAKWPGTLFPDGCVKRADGTAVPGFGGRGCYLSSTALAQAERTSNAISSRVADFTAEGQQSYFLDVDAAGQLFADHDPAHPQTREQDRELRLERMSSLARGDYSKRRPLVVGSETAAAWANPAISFSHGSSTPVFDGLWAAQSDRDAWGAYWPEDRPRFFFGSTELSKDLSRAMFDPKYRIPLYQAVLHDSVISTDRWEIDMYKVDGASKDRILLSMLYNSAPNYVWDTKAFAEHREEITRTARFFAAIQQAAGTRALTGFRALDGSGLVQRTSYTGGLTITANFGEKPANGVGVGCVVAEGGSLRKTTLCL